MCIGQGGDDQWYEPCTLQRVHVGSGEADPAAIIILPRGGSHCDGASRTNLARG
jgi:hypothetical protein